MQRFENKIVLVTGAGEGIGQLTAAEFVKEGAIVIVSDRNEGTGAATAARLRGQGSPGTIFIKADVSREADITALFEQIQQHFGRLDIAINNAGVEGEVRPIEEQTNANFEHVMGVNVLGTFLSMREEVKMMKAQGAGIIVNFASIAAHAGFAGLTLYTASKAAILAMTKSAALEVARSGIRICSISPGLVDTQMAERFFGGDEAGRRAMLDGLPLGRICTPLEIARTTLFLASDDASLIVGQTVNADGGWAYVKS